jgi:hypothetical protein
MNEWQQDIHDGLRREGWALRGPNMIVKVVPRGGPAEAYKAGYITLGKYLRNKTPHQIEKDLGLKDGELDNGARIYRFTRLPMQHEYTYELTADHPGGLKFNPAHGDPRYKPGNRIIHQWEIKKGMPIPVDSQDFVELRPGQLLPSQWLDKV